MHIVTTGPGDLTAKEKSVLIFTTQTINKNISTYCYLLVLLYISLGYKDTLVISIFEKDLQTFSKPHLLHDDKDIKHTINRW